MRLLLVLLFFTGKLSAQRVDTIRVYSKAMKKNISCVVIIPQETNLLKPLPVLYLLHGYGGSYDNWIKKVPLLKEYVSKYRMLIVCPDGSTNSWYLNSIIDSNVRYETFITQDLVKQIDLSYKTIRNKTGRAITGLSMGGHGALFLSVRHPEIFGAAGSMSGVVDLFSSRSRYEIIKLLGDTLINASAWKAHSVINLFDSVGSYPKMIIDCGIRDAFISSNRKLHEKLMKFDIDHDYIERDGKHNWSYWANALPYQLLFFSKFFAGK
jgi:S-formylglutathione hydrolase FrmB